MKKTHLIIVCFWFFQPIVAKAKPIKGISNFDGGFKGVERITFECPVNNEKNIQIREMLQHMCKEVITTVQKNGFTITNEKRLRDEIATFVYKEASYHA